jgi:hypothetical protein
MNLNTSLTTAALILACFLPKATAADSTEEPMVIAFLKEHCVRCHNATTKKGKFELHDLKTDIAGNNARFAAILERLRAGDMPPEKEPQPDLDTLKKVIDVIQAGLGKSTPGIAKAVEVPVRPADGNHLPHSLLFGGKPGPSVPPPA